MSASMRIKKRRDELGMTQEQLATEAGTVVQRINAIERYDSETKRGRNPETVEVRFAIRIARALKTTVEKLFT